MTREEKRALLEKLAEAGRLQQREVPLSPGQRRLWQLQSRAPLSPIYNIAIAYDLRGPLDAHALAQAVRQVAPRHECLQSTFSMSGGIPVQVIGSAGTVELDRRDVSSWPADERRPRLEQVLRAEAARPMDLGGGPLIRLTLFELGPREHSLLVVAHHIISDRWSLGILVDELGSAYSSLVNETAWTAPPLPHRYADFGRGQEEFLKGEDAASQREYWRQVLQPPLSEIELPTDRRPLNAPSSDGGRLDFEADPQVLADLATVARNENVTTYVVLLAGFCGLLHAHTSQDDLLFCLPVAGRHRPFTRGVVGYFNNLLPCRISLTGRPTLRELIRRVNAAMRGVFENQDLPFQDIAELPEVSLVPLSRCLFSLQNVRGLALRLPEIHSTYRDIPTGAVDFDLAVFLEQKGETMSGFIDYRTDRFSDAMIARIRDGFVQTLGSLASSLDVPTTDSDRPSTDLDSGFRRGPSPLDHATGSQQVPTTTRLSSAPGGFPRNELERRLVAIWESQMKIRPIATDSNFFELGGHSLLAARIFARMEELLERPLPLSLLLRAPTIAELSRLLTDEGWTPPWTSLVPIKPEGSKPPLFLVHAGAGGILTYRRLAGFLGAEQPVWGIESPREHHGDGSQRRIEDMAEDYLRSLQSMRPDGPYILGGHSFGGLVALEMAHRLLERNVEVPLLIILDHAGPDARRPGTMDFIRWHLACLRQLEPGDQFRYVKNRISWAIKANVAIPTPLRRLAVGWLTKDGRQNATWRLKNLDASLSAIENYKIRPYPGKMLLVRGDRSYARLHSDPQGGWGRIGVGGLDVVTTPGNHMSLFEEPNVRLLADRLSESLDRAFGLQPPRSHSNSIQDAQALADVPSPVGG